MTENSTGAISLSEAVERVTARAGADDETVETQEAEGTGNSDPEANEVEAEAETEDQDDADSDPEYEVDTAEGKRRVKLSELLESPMFKADYTRKTQSLAEERKALERSAAETAQLREQLSESLKRWAVPTEAEPDWAELATKLPPQEYNLRRVQWEQRQRQKEQARAEFHAMQDQLRAEAIATERNKLLEAFPEWRDEAKFLSAAKQMADGATVYGFSAEEVGQIADHRMIKVLRDAVAYRELQKAKPAIEKKVAEVKPSLQPGAKPNRDKEAEAARQKQLARFKKGVSLKEALGILTGE